MKYNFILSKCIIHDTPRLYKYYMNTLAHGLTILSILYVVIK